jgi:hypothetical protein
VDLTQDVAFGRPHAKIERREFFIAHNDDVWIGLLLVAFLGTSVGGRERFSSVELRPSCGHAAEHEK